MKKILLAVTNDLITDNRVHKIACTLLKSGAKVTIAGRIKSNSLPVNNKPYCTKRFRLLFNKGPFFYIEYNIRIFLFMLFRKFDIVVANDLDTLTGTYIASKIKKNILVYDSHEYFTEVPELVKRHFKRKIWKYIESKILPRIRFTYTVSESVANEYQRLYGINMRVVRNLPNYINYESLEKPKKTENFQILYQGSLNVSRGLEQIIDSMEFIDNAKLTIIGDGDITGQLKEQISSKNLTEKIDLKEKIPFAELINETQKADLGISLEENIGLNYYYSLPNKLFDYIQARVPVLVSPFPEMQKIVNQYDIGSVYDHKNTQALADKIKEIIKLNDQYQKWKDNTEKAAKELCWENEEKILFQIYSDAGLVF
ncbi:MAG: glycosyltransferase [Bacteroidales bacterium]|nr:glycosyltransferase [Bacteroidales bacterium]